MRRTLLAITLLAILVLLIPSLAVAQDQGVKISNGRTLVEDQAFLAVYAVQSAMKDASALEVRKYLTEARIKVDLLPMDSASRWFTSSSVAVSDSQRISLRIVKSR